MSQRFMIVALGLALVVAPWAQAAELVVQQTNLPLWKVAGDSNTVYLLGSIHFCREDFYPMPEPVQKAYRAADTVVFEVNPAELNSLKTQLIVVNQGMFPPGETLQKYISAETYKALAEYMEKQGEDMALLDQQKPWLAAVTLTALEVQKLGFDPEQGIDLHFHRRAVADGKRILGLETASYQLGLLSSMPVKQQEQMLKYTLKDLDQLPEAFRDIIGAWKSGDSRKLEKLLNEAMRDYPALWKRLVLDRNHNWVSRVERFRQRPKDVLVVVGMGHLIGKESLVELLKEKGISVEQVRAD